MVERGEEENASATAKFISWLRRRESSEDVNIRYSLLEDEEEGERELEKVNILLMIYSNMLASDL